MHEEKPAAQATSAERRDDEISESRRRLVKTALKTTPVVLTLHSGAAQALASGMVNQAASLDSAAVDANGNPVCFIATNTGNGWDLGSSIATKRFRKRKGCPNGTIMVAASSLASVHG